MQGRQRGAVGVDLEDRPVVVCSAIRRRSVEIPLGSLYQAREGERTVGANKAVERRQSDAACVDLEYRADTRCVPARGSRSIQVSVRALDQTSVGEYAVGTGKLVQRRKRRPIGADPEDRAASEFTAAGNAPMVGRPVEIPVRALDEVRVGPRAIAPDEAVQRRKRGAIGVELEDRPPVARASLLRRSIELPVRALDQARRGEAAAAEDEVVQYRKCRAARVDLEDGSVIVRTAPEGRSIEVTVGALDQASVKEIAVETGKAVKRRQRGAARIDLEDRPGIVCATLVGRSIEIPVRALDQSSVRVCTVAVGEAVEDRQRGAARVDPEDRPVSVRAATGSRSIEVSVRALNHARVGGQLSTMEERQGIVGLRDRGRAEQAGGDNRQHRRAAHEV